MSLSHTAVLLGRKSRVVEFMRGGFIKYLLYLSLCAVSLCHCAPPRATLVSFLSICRHTWAHTPTQKNTLVHTHTHSVFLTLAETECSSLMFRSQLVFSLHLECSLVTGDIMVREEGEVCVCERVCVWVLVEQKKEVEE